MPNQTEIVYLRGKLHWAKVLGEPVDNYDKNGKEWTFDVELDKSGVKQMNGIKVQGKLVKNIKNRDDERGDFVSFKQVYRELAPDRNGDARFTTAPDVLDAAGNAWPEDEKLGNGTVADIKFKVVDYGKGKYAGVYPMALRILDHVPYKDQTFAPLSDDDEYAGKAASITPKSKPAQRTVGDIIEESYGGHTAPDDLDDDIPFD